jgi:hypothetical protein
LPAIQGRRGVALLRIDPVIIGIANPNYFTFLKHCQPQTDIVLACALTMAKGEQQLDHHRRCPHPTPCRCIYDP